MIAGGDSAGGNIAAALCLLAADRGGPKIDRQLLIYPAADSRCDSDSHRRFASDYLLTHEVMVRFWELYAGDADPTDPLASILRAPDLQGSPATTLVLAGCDILYDEGRAYGEALAAADVSVDVLRYPGQVHGFWTYAAASDMAHVVNTDICSSLEMGAGTSSEASR